MTPLKNVKELFRAHWARKHKVTKVMVTKWLTTVGLGLLAALLVALAAALDLPAARQACADLPAAQADELPLAPRPSGSN